MAKRRQVAFLRTGRSTEWPHLPTTSSYPDWKPGFGVLYAVKMKCVECGKAFSKNGNDTCCGVSCKCAHDAKRQDEKIVLDYLSDRWVKDSEITGYFLSYGVSRERNLRQALKLLIATDRVKTSSQNGALVYQQFNKGEAPVNKGSIQTMESLDSALDKIDIDVVVLYQESRSKAKALKERIGNLESELKVAQDELEKVTDDLLGFRGDLLKAMKV